MTPTIRLPLHPRVIWIVGARIEIQYIDCRDEVVTRCAQDRDRESKVVRQVPESLGSR